MEPINNFFQGINSYFKKDKEEKDENQEIEDIITNKEYPLQIHTIETEDGYILKVYRIMGSKKSTADPENTQKIGAKQQILFQHGLLDSSDGWVCNDEKLCLPFLFANAGFDVWLSNSRGNKHSKTHKVYSPEDFEFWAFSFHEMGLLDLPAVLDDIQKINNSEEKIIYVGHSQGTCMLFYALTKKFEYFKS